ncbi:MAG: diaminopimelate epimerase [Saprospiraceae bacterium]|nr:diaminopimelate epimerase [Saprospiraceae bacterium]
MKLPFYKYQGTGNDFIIVDQFENTYLQASDQTTIKSLCQQKFGIGADGLMLLEPSSKWNFRMVYFNADGKEGSLCGNGSRCAVACSHQLARFGNEGSFEASDGVHQARWHPHGQVDIKISDINEIEQGKDFFVLNTGSPHYVTFVEDLSDLDIVQSGRAIRYSSRFADEGINVNFVEEMNNGVEVYTYERGVEDETLSCGTGVTASALAHALRHNLTSGSIQIKTKGGNLIVKFDYDGDYFTNIWLCGPATLVFKGEIDL